jgi:hypothetical protein
MDWACHCKDVPNADWRVIVTDVPGGRSAVTPEYQSEWLLQSSMLDVSTMRRRPYGIGPYALDHSRR